MSAQVFGKVHMRKLQIKQNKIKLYTTTNQPKKRTCKIVNFTVRADHRVKFKESEKKDKYFDIARILKKLWNKKVTNIPIVIGTHGIVTNGLIQGLENLEITGLVENIQITASLRSARLPRIILETLGHLLSLKLQ